MTYYNSNSSTKPRYRKSGRGGSYDVMQPLNDIDPEVKVKDAGAAASADDEAQCKRQPSLVLSLGATFWRMFLFGSFLKLVQDLLIFVNPQILK